MSPYIAYMDPMGLEYLAKWPNVHLAVDNQKDPLPSQVSVDSWNPTLASFLQTNIWRWSQGSSPDPHSTWDHHYWCLNHLKSFDAYITIFHIFHGQSPLFEYAKAVVFVLIPGFGAETKTRRSRPAFSCRSRRLALLSSTSCRAAGAEAWFSAMFVGLPSGKRLHNYGKSPFIAG